MNEHGVHPGKDVTLILSEVFGKYPEDTEFVFEPGDYHLSPKIFCDYRLSNTDLIPERRLGMLLKDMKNVRLTGNGSRLLCDGKVIAITIDHSEDVTIDGFTIDCEKPLVAEGVVVGRGTGIVDLSIDGKLYPHKVEDGKLFFDIGNGEWSELKPISQILFDSATKRVRRGTDDRFRLRFTDDLGNGVYRFSVESMKDTDFVKTGLIPDGGIFVLRHNERDHSGIFVEKSKRVNLRNINVYSCGGLGVLAQFTEDLTCHAVNFLPNARAGRLVASGRDDGMHVTNCSGTVTIEECSFLGLMDDPINVHSCCCTGVEWVNDYTLRCRYMHPQACAFHYWAEKGDEIAFIERRHMSRVFADIKFTVKLYTLEGRDTFLLVFDEPVSEEIRSMNPEDIAVDNLTHTAAFVCRHNRFGSCRARGVLVSVPKPVKIYENYFESSGSAILVAGDSNYWFESGCCKDVEIYGNVFTDACLSSMYQFCDGVISVSPVVPEPLAGLPYHGKINVHDNVFDTPGTPVLSAFSAREVIFRNNRIFASPSAKKWHPGENLVRLDHVESAVIEDNLKVGEFEISGMSVTDCGEVKGDI